MEQHNESTYPTEADIKYGLARRFTKEEYLAELADFEGGRVPQPNPQDHRDPLWQKKYAHCMPPLECYKFTPPDSKIVNLNHPDDKRLFHFGWNNLTPFETE